MRSMRFLAVAALVALTACAGETTGSTASSTPTLLKANEVIATTVGVPMQYDASQGGRAFSDPSAKGLTYSIAFASAANGLAATGCDLAGTPSAPGITVATITATDAAGRTATDRFVIVAFAAGLLNPTLPAALDHYSDATVALPTSFAQN